MSRRRFLGIGALALAVVAGVCVASPAARRKLSAAARAFSDPALVEPPPAAACGDGEDNPLVIDRTLAREHSPVDPLDTSESPDMLGLADLRPADLPVETTRRALRFAKFFGKHPVGRQTFSARYRRAGRYRRDIERELREAGLPEDLVWLAAIESGFDPTVTSTAGAAGMWQFMPETGGLYGLEQSRWIDERRSIRRATSAAVTHLRDLYERLGRWDLVLAAYNAGYAGVVRAIEQYEDLRSKHPAEEEHSGPVRFSDLAQAGLLPDETADYVPKIVGFAVVAANLARFNLDDLSAAEPIELSELTVPEGTPLKAVARAGGVSTAQLRDLNPELLHDRSPPDGGGYTIVVPADRLDQIRAALPAYLDHMVLTLDDPDDGGSAETRIGPNGDFIVVHGGRRPPHLGFNRLPAFPLPGDAPGEGVPSLRPRGPLEHILPGGLSGLDVGWRSANDPLSLLQARSDQKGKASSEARAIANELGLLDANAKVALGEVPFIEEKLPGGVLLRMRRDTTAARIAITVDAGHHGESVGATLLEGHSQDVRYTETIKSGDLDLGIVLAVGRLGLSLAEGHDRPVAALRTELGRARRQRLAARPQGKAWMALTDALFPPDGAFAGRVLSPEPPDTSSLAAALLLAERPHMRLPDDATLTLIGDFDVDAARDRVKRAFAELAPAGDAGDDLDARVGRPPIIVVEDADISDKRVLFGWRVPGAGSPGEVGARLALEILAGKKDPVLGRELVAAGLAVSVRAFADVDPQADALVIEVVAPPSTDVAAIDEKLAQVLDDLAARGPSTLELAIAKAMLKYRLEQMIKRADPAAERDEGNLADRLWRSYDSDLPTKTLQTSEKATSAAVRDAFRRQLVPLRRAAVVLQRPAPPAVSPGDRH